MSLADELLNTVAETDISDTAVEPHIVINPDRTVTMPEELKTIAVQFDHNVKTVHFDCPRYWDGHDMSTMNVYINFMRSDNVAGSYKTTVTAADETMMYFDWTIQSDVTQAKGEIAFLVCVKKLDEDGVTEVRHWNSELCRDVYISEGLEAEQLVISQHPDVITQLLETPVSPVVEITEIEGGHRVTITDINSTSSFDVKDGKDGEPGADGDTPVRGVDYFTPEDVADIVADTKAQIEAGERYEKIESIETTEEVNEIKRTLEPDGTAYAFKRITANIYCPKADAAASMYVWNGSGVQIGYVSSAVNTGERYSRVTVDVSRGYLESQCTTPTGKNSYQSVTVTAASVFRALSVLDGIRFTAGTKFPTGTKIDIYGVRA